MARGQNFFYQSSPVEAIGASLGKALFGDPEMAAKQREAQSAAALTDARTQQALSSAGYDDSRTTGQDYQNTSAASLPDLIARLTQPRAAAAPTAPVADASGYYPDTTVTAPAGPNLRGADIGSIIAALAGSQGDKVDVGETIGALTAMLGNDGDARRGMVAQGITPGKDFALTADRADDIAGIANDADLAQALGVARINNESDIPIANIQATTARRGQDVRSGDTRRGQDISSGDRQRGQDIKADGQGYDRGGAISLGNTLGTVTSTVRSAAHNKKVGGVANSYHTAARGGRGIDIARAPGVTHAQVVAKYKAQGFTILEQLDEGDHSHLALGGGPGKAGKGAAGAKPPRGISQASAKMISGELETQITAKGATISPRVQTAIRAEAIRLFQQSGNPVAAVRDAMTKALRSSQQNIAAAGKKPAPPAARGGGVNVAELRRTANASIGKGYDAAGVRAKFKQMTGQNL